MVSTLRPATQQLLRHPQLVSLALPLQEAPFPFAEVGSYSSCHTKPSDSPLLPSHPQVPFTVLLQVWGISDSLVHSSSLQMQVTAEAHNTWTL